MTSPAKPTAKPAPATDPVQAFLDRLRQSLAEGTLVRLQLAQAQGGAPDLDKLLVRPLRLRDQAHLSFVWRHTTKDITKNWPEAEGVAEIGRLLAGASTAAAGLCFRHAHLVTTGHDVQLLPTRLAGLALRVGTLKAPPGGAASDTHDRPRQRALSLTTPFLVALGVTDAQHRLVPAMARKWRQINKFIEVLDHALGESPLAQRDPVVPVRVLDFGAGKGYLTFAVHHHLLAMGRQPEVTGVELRDDLTQLGNDAAQRLHLQGLRFVTGDVRHHAQGGAPLDVMIALHACDTATDVAMHHGLRAGAAIILCSPCCHKELRPQMQAPALLQPMLRHGIHMTEQAEMLTDSLRALLLQAEGYDTQVFEFISPEHTGKNKMVLAVRRAQAPSAAQRARLLQQVAELKAHYSVRQQTLEALLQQDAAAASP